MQNANPYGIIFKTFKTQNREISNYYRYYSDENIGIGCISGCIVGVKCTFPDELGVSKSMLR